VNSNVSKTFSPNDYIFSKKITTSGGSRSSYILNSPLPLHIKVSKLYNRNIGQKGRSYRGVVCRSKGKIYNKLKYPYIYKSFKLKAVSFISSIFIVRFKFKLYSLIISSNGCVSYLYTSYTHNLFEVYKLQGFFYKTNKYHKKYGYLSKYIKIPNLNYFILQLPKNKFVSLLEISPNKGVEYVKSSGSKAVIKKVDTQLSISLVKLPSGVHKTFSVYGVGSKSPYPFVSSKYKRQSNAGFNKALGKKSLSRGVARNPVDHPHGGRTKSVKYQRTP